MKKTKLYNNILEALQNMDDSELVTLWNEYTNVTNYYDDYIYTSEELEDIMDNSQEGALYWVNRFFYGSDDYSTDGSANPNRDYFQFNGYGNIVSFDYVGYNQYTGKFSKYIDEDALIDYIIDHNDALYNDDIQDILNEADEEEA